MKKLLSLLLALILVTSFTACSAKNTDTDPAGNTNESENLEGSLEEILGKIYDEAKVSEDFKEWTKTGLQIIEINDENIAYHLGKEGIEFESAIASEPLMMPSAYSLCLVRAKEGADIEEIKAKIKENADPMKWICVGIDPKNVIVDNIGDVIILIMSDNEGKALHDAFLALKK